ncbi:MAG: GNAT family N-acetyltransferase [Candidatus Lokiarchaeota archaeon]|nr:GNAT family N-acetyltransferase [Candidatus Lokiarchaeota archaeon]
MTKIIYRCYQEGDDEQLAHLYNLAFQMNGAGFVRTPKEWNWRYVQSPNFESEMVQIAEDKDQNRIIGAVHVNLIEEFIFNNKAYLFGQVNDVICHPDYTKRGVATKLLERAIQYMEIKKCDFSILTADYNGFPRKKLYFNTGYKDIEREMILFNFPNPYQLIKDFPGLLYLLPAFFMFSFIPRIINRILHRFNHKLRNFNYEIVHNEKHYGYMKAMNKIMAKSYTGFAPYNKMKFNWARINNPTKRHYPTYIFIREDNVVIGGAVISSKNIYSFKHGIKIRMGLIHEIFIDKQKFTDKRHLYHGYRFLIDKVLKAATKRFCGFLLFQPSENDHDTIKSFKSMGFLKFASSIVMIKSFKHPFNLIKRIKPLFIPTYISLAFP